MELLTKKQFKLQLLDTMEEIKYLEQVAKEVGYSHPLFKLVTNYVRRPNMSYNRYYYVYGYNEYNRLGDNAKKIADTQDNTSLFYYASELNDLKGSNFYHKVFAD